jgi:hypothetical protein
METRLSVHTWQKILPHTRQWCLLTNIPNALAQPAHRVVAESGIQIALAMFVWVAS